MKPATAWTTGHLHAEAVCNALATGGGFALRHVRSLPPAPVLGPGVDPRVRDRRIDGPAFFYGRLRGSLEVMRAAIAAGENWYMADNGYMGAGHYRGFYKISRNAFQCRGNEYPDYQRLEALKITIAPTRTSGGHILVCPPIPEYDAVMGFNSIEWLADVKFGLGRASQREIRVRWKPGDPRGSGGKRRKKTLAEDLADCWALVTHDSNVVVESVIAGVPVFATGQTPVLAIGDKDIGAIETPRRPGVDERRRWLATLAANQWTLDEMREGRCQRDLGVR